VGLTIGYAWAGNTGPLFLFGSVVPGSVVFFLAVKVAQGSTLAARQLFFYSMMYLALLFAALVVDTTVFW
jgi:heme O synthase-like polyprenyltransferase